LKPSFSIITPSLMRESLVRCCESVNSQTYPNFQHIVALDCPYEEVTDALLDRIRHPNREIFCCGQRFGNYGNHARWMAWEKATNEYLIWLDDDNEMFHVNALADIARSLEDASLPDFAIFPIHRHGRWFFNDPPGMCMTDSANVIVKREIGRWPDIVAREADGVLVDSLRSQYSYVAFPGVEAIVLMEKSSNGI
jgi:glycosyltransferase involved in cell wall biosynthesis